MSGDGKKELKIKHLPKGTYFLNLIIGNKNYVQKITIQ
ncbi:T9SS type A sorting domain-containing protein [Crocinitomix algicola]